MFHVDQFRLAVDDLVENLQGRACTVERGGTVERGAGNAVLASIPKSLSAEGSRREFDLYLRAWEARHPGARATRVGER